jgi:perosamine synthetase
MTVPVTLKPISNDDAELVFNWRNDPFISSLGSLNKKVTWEEHTNWINKTINNPLRKAYIIMLDHVPAGLIRFDRDNTTSDVCVLSVYLIKEHTGKGAGVNVIEQGCERISNEWKAINTIHALVLIENIGGQRAFKKAGFAFSSSLTDQHHYGFVYCTSLPAPHNKITFDHTESKEVTSIINSGYWANGTKVKELEERLTQITSQQYAICVSSGLSAIRVALIALQINAGDEIIVPAYSCVALANAVLSVGAIPVPVDIDPHTLNINTEILGQHITVKTKAIIAVHTFGYPADIKSLKRFNLPVIEDCAHALNDQNTLFGHDGDIVVCSFYATKLVGGGEGGAVLTNNENIAKIALDYRDYTDKQPNGLRLNEKLSNVHAALTFTQLNKLSDVIERRKRIAKRYQDLLAPIQKEFGNFSLPNIDKDRIWYRYVLTMKDISGDIVIEQLRKKEVYADKPVEIWVDGKSYPNTISAFTNNISLPFYPTLTGEQQVKISIVIRETLKSLQNEQNSI